MKVFDGFGLSIEGELTPEARNAAKKLAADIRLEAEARRLLQHRKLIRLPNGGYAQAVKHGDIVRVRMVLPEKPVDTSKQPPFKLPDFASGWINDPGVSGAGTVDGYVPTPNTIAKFRGVDQRARFNVTPSGEVTTAGSPTQYDRPHAGWYTGQMEKLVQFVYGYGKPGASDLYREPLRQLLRELRTGYPRRMSVAHQQALTEGVKLRYNHDIYRTHGVAVGTDGRRWIVEIGIRGIYALPMRYWPFTDIPRFKEIVTAFDPDARIAIDTFGGLPTGETVPVDQTVLDAMVRAGTALRLATQEQMVAVYGSGDSVWDAISTSYGWAFNNTGTAAHAVLRTTPLPQGNLSFYPKYRHWAVELSIGARTPTPQMTARKLQLVNRFERYTGASAQLKEAVLAKVPYLTDSQLTEFLGEPAVATAFNALNAVVIPPQAQATATINLREEAWSGGGDPAFLVSGTSELKFQDLVQHRPIINQPDPLQVKLFPESRIWSAPIHVWFHGDELKVLRLEHFDGISEYYVPGRENDDSVPMDSVTEHLCLPDCRAGAFIYRRAKWGLPFVERLPEYGVDRYVDRPGQVEVSVYFDHTNFAAPYRAVRTTATYTPPNIWSDGGYAERVLYGIGTQHWQPTLLIYINRSASYCRIRKNALGPSTSFFAHRGPRPNFPADPFDASSPGWVVDDYWNAWYVQDTEFRTERRVRKPFYFGEQIVMGDPQDRQQWVTTRDGNFMFVGVV